MDTTEMLVETPIKNLLNLHPSDESGKTYFYFSGLDEFIKENGGNVIPMFPEVSSPQETTRDSQEGKMPRVEVEHTPTLVHTTKRFNKQQTATSFVKKIIRNGVTQPMTMISQLLDAMVKGEIKATRSHIILCGVVKHALKVHMKQKDPRVVHYKDLLTLYGDEFKIHQKEVANMFSTLQSRTVELEQKKRHKAKSVTPTTFSVGIGAVKIS